MTRFCTVCLALILLGCGESYSSSNGSTTTPNYPTRTVDANTTASGTTFNTCNLLTRDTSSCQSARTTLGLSGNWLDFSCNVVEGLATSSLANTTNIADATYVTLTTTDLPDYVSNYYTTSGTYSFTANSYTVTGNFADMHGTYSPSFPDPGTIGSSTIKMYIPLNPMQAAAKSQRMGMGVVGMAINGVAIFNSMAANMDNIFAEADSFDQCGGHPAGSQYHYHSEAYSISHNDNKLIGVLRDGFFVYGRNDHDGTTPGSLANVTTNTSDIYVYGGHSGVPDPVTNMGSTFHYHLTEWKGCYHESGMTKSPDDGETDDTFNSISGTCGGTWTDGWFMTGHGNGGAFATSPGGSAGQSPSQTTAGIRYYYGTAGSCTGC